MKKIRNPSSRPSPSLAHPLHIPDHTHSIAAAAATNTTHSSRRRHKHHHAASMDVVDNNCGRRRCNCFNGEGTDSSDDDVDSCSCFGESNISSIDACEILKCLVGCGSVNEANLLAEIGRIVEKNKITKRKDDFSRKIVTDGLVSLGYDAPVGKNLPLVLLIFAGLLNPTDGFLHVQKPGVFQNPDHQVVMPTVKDDVAFGLGKFNLSHDEIKLRVAKALDSVGMYDYLQRPVQTLSGGQKQRVAIAGALAETCKVLLLDELTTFLDENDQMGVIKAVKNTLNGSEGVTALWVTHRLEELEYADGAVYMEYGRVVMHGEASRIMDFVEAKQASYIQQLNA